MQNQLLDEEKKLLLDIAKGTIVEYVNNGTIPQWELNSGNLTANMGCFVTIKNNGMLRGCIGNFVSDKPLYHLVQEMAVSAATGDPRFYPMKKEDLKDFRVEISVLSPMQKISSIDEIEVGVHGLYMEKNFSRGVLLPQVAVEYGWDRETFLSQTSIKAGLTRDAWKEGAEIYIFSAEVF
ncbi:MAG: hypothetical protein FD174_285 [Geobacteraceae bacterium]|nr:MAG: hypothetical protein FD174_285 [Geobacteraceae bacterium]